MSARKRLNIIFASSEVAPFVKTGGLADVSSGLPRALSAAGHNVIVTLPLYGSIKRKGLKNTGLKIAVNMDGRTYTSRVFKGSLDAKTKVYFFDQPNLYGRPGPYGDAGGDYPDNDARFIFFNRAVIELAVKLDFRPDIVHGNDWQCGLIPACMRNTRQSRYFEKTASIFSIHNLAYQGFLPKYSLRLTGLPPLLFTTGSLEMHGLLGMLKSGVVFADAVTTVSPTYAREILTAEGGFGMDGVLKTRSGSLYGILNGIDTDEWNPAKDKLISKRYTRKNSAGKAKCRAALLKEFGLKNDPERPVAGIVSRLVGQKGFDMLAAGKKEMEKAGFILVALGTGEPKYEKWLLGLQEKFPDRVGVRIGYDNALAHRITAGADIFLMPSNFEPCGLNQMYSLRYGTIPIVRATGGLSDTVSNWRPLAKKGNGFVFKKPVPRALFAAVKRCVKTFSKKREWKRIMDNAMSGDFSWKKSASLYLQVYKKVLP